MKLATYKKPSTFSYPGRHATFFAWLVETLRGKVQRRVLEVGSGCFEPIWLSHLLDEKTKLIAVEYEKEICDILKKLLAGERIELATLVEVVCNKLADGSCRKNTDLTEPELIQLAETELRLAGFDPNMFIRDGFFQKPQVGYYKPAEIEVVNADAFEYIQKIEPVDLLLAGVVLLNVGKLMDVKEFFRMHEVLANAVKNDGVLGVATTPRALYSEKSVPRALMAAGLNITDIVVENFALVHGNLFGGYGIRCSKDQSDYSLGSQYFFKFIEIEDFFSGFSFKYKEMTSKELELHLQGEGELVLLTANKAINGNYLASFILREELQEKGTNNMRQDFNVFYNALGYLNF